MSSNLQKVRNILNPPEQPKELHSAKPLILQIEEFEQKEIVEIDPKRYTISIIQSFTEIKEVISISQVYSDLGRPITDIRFFNGGVINVYKYHDHTEYFFGGTIGKARKQTFEEKLAVVAEYTDPNFTMWLWETDERVQIHYKMLKLNGDFTYLEPQRFINSVVKLRYVVGGYPFLATLEEFRPQKLPPLVPNLPPLEPKISPAIDELSPPKPCLPPSKRELPLPRSEVLPQEEERVEEYYQAEIVEICQLTNQIRIKQSLSNAHEVILISQVYSELGRSITDIRFLNGGVINVYKYHDHTEYFLGVRRQAFEVKTAIVENYTDPNFTMWLWETDERVQIPFKMLNLNCDFTYLEPQRFINSVVKLRCVVGGYPFSANLEDFRPQEPELPPSECNLPPFEPEHPPPSEILQPEQRPTEMLLELWRHFGGSICEYVVHLTKESPESGDSQFLTQLAENLKGFDDSYAIELSEKLVNCVQVIESYRAATEQSIQLGVSRLEQNIMLSMKQERLRLQSIAADPFASRQPQSSSQDWPAVDSQSPFPQQHHFPAKPQARPDLESQTSFPPMPKYPTKPEAKPFLEGLSPFLPQPQYPAKPQVRPAVESQFPFPPHSQYSAQPQARPAVPSQSPRYAVPKCHSCVAGVQLYPFCSHEFCRNCIIRSVFALECLSCQATLKHVPHSAFEAFNIQCNGCKQMHLTMDVCNHKICKECMLLMKHNKGACFICDKVLDDAYLNILLEGVGLVCSLCNSQKSSHNFMVFDCKCNLCVDCVLPSAQSSTCPKCHTPRNSFDREQLGIYLG